MTKSKLYTATGDNGTTSLVGGQRVPKNSTRLEAYGTIDEFSATLGLILSSPSCPPEIKQQLLDIQDMLFNFGGYLATLPDPDTTPAAWGLTQEHIEALERAIDTLDEKTPKVNAFVLPGGCMEAAYAHLARTVCRRAERRVLDLTAESYVDPALLRYLNRLSDYLFILARYLNFVSGTEEITWHKH